MKIAANGIEVHYTLAGEGPLVTLSHSLGCNLSMWDDQIRALTARYRVLAFDTRGHGQSSAPPGPYTLEQMAEDVHELFSGLGIRETHFVGLSMGGMIGQVLALAHPEMVRSLTLCDTTSHFPGNVWPVWEERIRAVQKKGMEAVVDVTLQRWFTARFRARRPDAVDRIRAAILNTPVQGYIGCSYGIPKINVTDRLHAIRCPALVIVGEEDPGTTVEMARTLHAALPSAELAILRSAAHLSNIEQREEFNRVLLGFLDRVMGRTSL
jgi:3-oxoadipate enol-lactonase